MWSFLVDAQLPRSLAVRLAEAGHDAVHVTDVGLLDATDLTIWQVATEQKATIVSEDEDFVMLSVRVRSGPQVLWLRTGNVGNRVLWGRLCGALPQIVAALEAGERVIEFR